jgi:hypothetical protein
MNIEEQGQKPSEMPKQYSLSSQIATLKSLLGVESIDVENIQDGVIPITLANPEDPDTPKQLTAIIESNGKGRISYGDCYAHIDLSSQSTIRETIKELAESKYINMEQYQAAIEQEILAIIPEFDLNLISYGSENNVMSAYFKDDKGFEYDIQYSMYLSEPRISLIISNRTGDGEDSVEEFSGNDLDVVVSYL